MKTLEDYRISGLRLRSVDHCTKVGLPYVSMDATPVGEPVGWSPDTELGGFSRGSAIYSGLYIHHPEFGDCWGHVLTQQLPQIFDLN